MALTTSSFCLSIRFHFCFLTHASTIIALETIVSNWYFLQICIFNSHQIIININEGVLNTPIKQINGNYQSLKLDVISKINIQLTNQHQNITAIHKCFDIVLQESCRHSKPITPVLKINWCYNIIPHQWQPFLKYVQIQVKFRQEFLSKFLKSLINKDRFWWSSRHMKNISEWTFQIQSNWNRRM